MLRTAPAPADEALSHQAVSRTPSADALKIVSTWRSRLAKPVDFERAPAVGTNSSERQISSFARWYGRQPEVVHGLSWLADGTSIVADTLELGGGRGKRGWLRGSWAGYCNS